MRAKIGLLLVVLLGALLAACTSNGIFHQADPATKELVIRTWANDSEGASLTVTTADGDYSGTADVFTWYFDVPNDQVEYLVEIKPFTAKTLHLHQDKAPQK